MSSKTIAIIVVIAIAIVVALAILLQNRPSIETGASVESKSTSYYYLDCIPYTQVDSLAKQLYSGYVVVIPGDYIYDTSYTGYVDVVVYGVFYVGGNDRVYTLVVLYGDPLAGEKYLSTIPGINPTRADKTREYSGYKLWVFTKKVSPKIVVGRSIDDKTLGVLFLHKKYTREAEALLVKFMDAARKGDSWKSIKGVDELLEKIPVDIRSKWPTVVLIGNGSLSIAYMEPRETPGLVEIHVVLERRLSNTVLNTSLYKMVFGKEIVSIDSVASSSEYVLYRVKARNTSLSSIRPIVALNWLYLEIRGATLMTIHLSETRAVVHLGIKLANTCEEPITITDIRVDNIRPSQADKIIGVKLRPGQIYRDNIVVLWFNPEKKPNWESGTRHTITIQYSTLSLQNLTVSTETITR